MFTCEGGLGLITNRRQLTWSVRPVGSEAVDAPPTAAGNTLEVVHDAAQATESTRRFVRVVTTVFGDSIVEVRQAELDSNSRELCWTLASDTVFTANEPIVLSVCDDQRALEPRAMQFRTIAVSDEDGSLPGFLLQSRLWTNRCLGTVAPGGSLVGDSRVALKSSCSGGSAHHFGVRVFAIEHS